MIGVSGEDVDTQGTTFADAGYVNVLRGATGYLTDADNKGWHQGMLPSRVEVGDRLGRTLVAGDIDGDGNDDVAFGVPYEDVEDEVDAGAVFVLYEEWYPELFGEGLSAEGAQIWHQDR